MSHHDSFIRRCYELAVSAAAKGNHPFGAVLVHRGRVIAEAENTVVTDRDQTRHAELNLVVVAQREYPLTVLHGSTLYSSTAPCAMCAAAMWSSGIRRVVYGVAYETFASIIPGKHSYIPIEEVYERLGTPLEAVGGVLEEEGVKVYDHWPEP
jgi:tRNA(Arg) A34 adenosine deaminase TadA